MKGRRWPDGQMIEVINGQPVEILDEPTPTWLVGGITDNHCHILPTGIDMQRLNLDDCDTKEKVFDAVGQRLAETEPGDWVLAVHYDQNRFESGAHLSRRELDQLSADHPILLRHVNGHASVANTLALERAGVGPGTPNPKGGEFVRDGSGQLTGVLLERAHEFVTDAVPKPNLDQMVSAIVAAGQSMLSYGVTSATDMMTGYANLDLELQAYRIASEMPGMPRLRLFLQWSTVLGPRAIDSERLQELQMAMNPDRCVIDGLKIFADGALGSRTAAIYGQYEGSAGQDDEGQLIYAADRLNEMVRIATDKGYSVAIHSIGDRSTDLVLDAFAKSGAPEKHRLEHAMLLSDAQIERIASLGTPVTMQPEFLVRFGSSYRRNLGEARASKLKRLKSILEAHIPLTLSSDRPIVAGNPKLTMKGAIQRPAGFDPAENISFHQALAAMTTDFDRKNTVWTAWNEEKSWD